MNKLLGAMIALFTVVLVVQWSFSQNPEQPGNTTDNTTDVSGGDVAHVNERASAPPLVSFDDVVKRPLFIEARRPPPEQDDGAETEAPKPPRKPARRPVADLTAILIIDSEQYAVFRTASKKKGLEKLKVGEQLDGWKIAKIDAKQVTLRQGTAKEVFLLRKYKKVPLPAILSAQPDKKAAPQAARNGKDRKNPKPATPPKK